MLLSLHFSLKDNDNHVEAPTYPSHRIKKEYNQVR